MTMDRPSFFELTFLLERVLFEDADDADTFQRCKVAGDQFRTDADVAALADALRLTVGHRLNGDHAGARAWEAVAERQARQWLASRPLVVQSCGSSGDRTMGGDRCVIVEGRR